MTNRAARESRNISCLLTQRSRFFPQPQKGDFTYYQVQDFDTNLKPALSPLQPSSPRTRRERHERGAFASTWKNERRESFWHRTALKFKDKRGAETLQFSLIYGWRKSFSGLSRLSFLLQNDTRVRRNNNQKSTAREATLGENQHNGDKLLSDSAKHWILLYLAHYQNCLKFKSYKILLSIKHRVCLHAQSHTEFA